MLKLLSALVAAAGIAGVLTFLPGATSARLAASPPVQAGAGLDKGLRR